MQNENTVSLPGFEAQVSTEKQVSQSRRAKPPEKWAMRVELPLVRESMRDAAGGPVRARAPADVAALCADLGQSAQEAFVVIDLTAKNTVIDKRLVTLGILDASLVHPREVFRGAIVNNAAGVIVCHGHPSGDPTPSAEDVRITRQLVEAGRILSIKVLDHVVLGKAGVGRDRDYVSMREEGIVSFS